MKYIGGNRMIFVTAHSGCEGTKSNSMDSIKAGVQSGADYIEVDVLPTQDGVAVLSHDDEFKGVPISQTLYKDLQGHLVTLKDALDYVMKAGKKMNIDVKDVRSVDSFASYIEEKGYEDRIVLSGCRDTDIVYLTNHYPNLPKLYNIFCLLESDLMSTSDHEIRHKLFDDGYKLEQEKRDHILKMMKTHQIQGINIHFKQLDDSREKWATENNIPVYVWTVDAEQDIQSVLKRDITSITTNNVAVCRSIINS